MSEDSPVRFSVAGALEDLRVHLAATSEVQLALTESSGRARERMDLADEKLAESTRQVSSLRAAIRCLEGAQDAAGALAALKGPSLDEATTE